MFNSQLETENKSLMDRVEKLEWSDQIQKGAFYSLQEAYEKEFLTREDLMHIAYFEYGKVEEKKAAAKERKAKKQQQEETPMIQTA